MSTEVPNEAGVLLDSYAQTLAEAKRTIQAARTRATLAVNPEVIGVRVDPQADEPSDAFVSVI